MKLTIRIVLIAAGLATVPAAAAILGSTSLSLSRMVPVLKTNRITISFHDKSQARVITAADNEARNRTRSPIELAQAIGQPLDHPNAGAPEGFPAQFGALPFPHHPESPDLLGFAHPPGPPPPPRIACEEDIDHLMAVTGYLKSKMRLQGEQKIAWQKVEQAAEPGVEKMRDLCARLPYQPAEPPSLPERIDFAEKQMTARVELLRAVREPLRALYETLSPDQRALLVIAPPAHHLMPPSSQEDRL